MTVRLTISLPEEMNAFVEELVESGAFASNSDLIRHGLRLVERERAEERRKEEEHQARLQAIREDLAERAKGPFMSLEEGNRRFEAMMAEQAKKHGSSS